MDTFAQRLSDPQVLMETGHAAAILSTAADAIIGVDRDGIIVTVNPATTSVFGVQPEQVIGRPLSTMVPGLGGAAIRDAIQNGIWLHVSQCFVARQQITGVRQGGVIFPRACFRFTFQTAGEPTSQKCQSFAAPVGQGAGSAVMVFPHQRMRETSPLTSVRERSADRRG